MGFNYYDDLLHALRKTVMSVSYSSGVVTLNATLDSPRAEASETSPSDPLFILASTRVAYDKLTAEMKTDIRPFATVLVEQHFNYEGKGSLQHATRQMSAPIG